MQSVHSMPTSVRLYLMLALAVVATPSFAQMSRGNGRPQSITPVTAKTAVFSGSDGSSGTELWEIDLGRVPPELRLADVHPGVVGSYPSEITRGSQPAPGYDVYFTAYTAALGREPYRYDSSTGLSLLSDIRTGAKGSNPTELTMVGSMLFFAANDGTTGRELWVHTASGTRLVKDIYPGAVGSAPHNLVAHGSRLLFVATRRDPVTLRPDTELWVSDGTSAGTSLLIDLEVASSSWPSDLVEWNGQVYFAATTKGTGREIFRTDGTKNGTTLAVDIRPGAASSYPEQLTAGIGVLACVASHGTRGRELFRIDTALTGTWLSDFPRGETISHLASAPNFPTSDFYFAVNCSAAGGSCSGNVGIEPWRSTSTGVQRVADLNPGPDSSYPSNFEWVLNASLNVVFRADNGKSGQELFEVGALSAPIRDIKRTQGPGVLGRTKSAWPSSLTRLGSILLFSAESDANGIELWATDGRFLAMQVADMDSATPLPELHGEPGSFVFELTDARATAPYVLIVATNVRTVLTAPSLPFLGGGLILDLAKPWLAFPRLTDVRGNDLFTIPIPPAAPALGAPLGWQAFVIGGPGPRIAAVDASSNISCTTYSGTNGGASVLVQPGCVDDDTGEYRIDARRTDNNGNTLAWLALVREKSDTGDLVFAKDVSGAGNENGHVIHLIEASQQILLEGRVNFALPKTSGDPLGDRLQLRLFLTPPVEGELGTGVVVWQSYC